MSRGLQRVFAAAALVLLVALAITARFLQPESNAPEGSVDSAGPEGRKALLLLLQELGFDAEAWREAPEQLVHERGMLWLSCVPPRSGPVSVSERSSPSGDETKKEDESNAGNEEAPSPARAGAFSLGHYGEFVRSGGVLVIAASQETRRFLLEDLGIPGSAIPPSASETDAGVRTFEDTSGEPLSIDVRKNGILVPGPESSAARPIVAAKDEDGFDDEILAAEIPLGAGRVVLLGDDAFLANSEIGKNDHALLAARLGRDFAPDRRVLFDEYALGTWQPGTPVAILASPRLFLATLHALLLIGLVVLGAAWAREFPRDPMTQRTTSPLLRARALGGLLVRAKRFDVLSRFLLEGAARGLERRDLRAAHALRERSARPAGSARELEDLADEVRAIERAAG